MASRMLVRAVGLLALCCLGAAPASAASPLPLPAAERATAGTAPRAVLVFLPGPVARDGRPPSPDPLLRALERRPGLAVGLMGPTQGSYSPQQALLDITQGTRVSPVAYRPRDPGPLRFLRRGRGGAIAGWAAAVRRAATAPGDIAPGRLAAAIPSRVGFAGVTGASSLDAVAAADRAGRVAEVSIGPGRSLAARAGDLLRRHRLVVVVAAGSTREGLVTLDALLAARASGELVVAAQSPPHIDTLQLLPIALTTAAAGHRGLTSDTTRTDGVVTGIDLLPTFLRHLGLAVPGSVTGQAIQLEPARAAPALERLRTRYTHVAPRRIRTLEALLAVWVLVTAALAAVLGPAGARRGLRIGALALLWVPSLVLVPSVIDPPAALAETAMVTIGAFVLGALTDLALPWPRGPVLPAAVCLVAYVLDLALGTSLIDLSLLGPNPRSGARFFGIGNELEPALPILLFLGVAAAFGARPRSRAMAIAFAGLGAAVAAVVGSGYLGADVGGVITISAGTAVATLAVLPGGLTRRAVVIAALVPLVAVGLLAALDLATGASSHFSRNVLEVQGGASLWEVIGRRYQFALHSLVRGKMPFVTAGAVLAVAVAIRARGRLYGRLPGPAWTAALAGGLAAGVVGALTNDSGPLLFVVAVFVLGLATAYLIGEPAHGAASPPERAAARPGGRRPAALAAMQESDAARRPEGGRPPATVP